MANDSESADALDETEELPPSLGAWFAIEECVGATLDALAAFDDEASASVEFVSEIHRRVKSWLAFEFWAALLDPGLYTPDTLLVSLIERGVSTQRLPAAAPVVAPRPLGRIAWKAFGEGDGRG
jgi:hypothetical protein